MLAAVVRAIDYYLPKLELTNTALAAEFPEWSVDRIADKTGIEVRHVARPEECSSDLAVAAATKLFSEGSHSPKEIDFVLLCTQTPDYALPTTACLIQHRLGVPTTAGAFDFNLGCSGFVYGLSICKGLVETGQAKKILFLTAETYTKLLDPSDKGVRTIFGDAGAATLVEAEESAQSNIGPFVFGTDGAGGPNLICHQGGFREGTKPAALHMNGAEIFDFTLRAVPDAVSGLLAKASLTEADVDFFVFHQANAYMLEHLRRKLGIAPDRFLISMAQSGNTVSSTIPIVLKDADARGLLKSGHRIMLVGFGVGYSWCATILTWR